MLALLLFTLCVAVEFSPRINTDNVAKKIGIGFVMIGALVEMVKTDSPFIEIGLIMYLSANLCTAYLSKPKRRASDNG